MVLTFLDPSGKALAGYTLAQVLGKDEILWALHTESSVWWDSRALFEIRETQKQFVFQTERGTLRAFDLTNGRQIKLAKDERALA
jgi:hypothetical protein